MARRPTPLKIVGGIIRFLFYALIAFIFALLLWRMFFSTRVPESIDRISANETLAAEFERSGDDIYMFTQEQSTITRAEDNYGYFSVVDFVIIPEAKQVQVVFRYNNSTIDHVAEDYLLDEIPARSEELFDLTLIKTVDLTPDDPTDNTDRDTLREERYFPTSSTSGTTLLYNYRRVTFDGVSIDDATGLFFDIYYNQRIDYEGSAYGTLCIYDYEMERVPVKLSGAEKSALRALAK